MGLHSCHWSNSFACRTFIITKDPKGEKTQHDLHLLDVVYEVISWVGGSGEHTFFYKSTQYMKIPELK